MAMRFAQELLQHGDAAAGSGVRGRLARVGVGSCLVVIAVLGAGVSSGVELGSGWLEIVGIQLTLSPANQTVALDTEAFVTPRIEVYDPENRHQEHKRRDTPPPPGSRVLGDLSGPGIEGVIVLETVPGEPFRIPALEVEGEYRLEDVWLVEDGEFVRVAEPSSAVITVKRLGPG